MKQDREELEQRFVQIDEAIAELQARSRALQSVTGVIAAALVPRHPFLKDAILRVLETSQPPPDADPLVIANNRRTFGEVREVFNKVLSKALDSNSD